MTEPIKTIRMWRPEEGGIKTADVHPDEAENWQNTGWRVGDPPVANAEPEVAEPETAKRGRPKAK